MAEELRQPTVSVDAGEGEVKDRGLFDFGRKKHEVEEGKPQEALVTSVQSIHLDEGHKAPTPPSAVAVEEDKKLHRTHSSSSSSSSSSGEEEEVEGEGGIKQKIKKKKKILKEKIDEKLHRGDKKGKEKPTPPIPVSASPIPAAAPPPPIQHTHAHESSINPAIQHTPVHGSPAVAEKVDSHGESPLHHEEEKKGFLEKIKEKLPGHGKKTGEEVATVSPPATTVVLPEHGKEHEESEGAEGKEKKGLLGKIMEKLPGYHKNDETAQSPTGH